MSSLDERLDSSSPGLQLPGLISQFSPVEQLPFPEYSPIPAAGASGITRPFEPIISSPTTLGLPGHFMSPAVTRTLPEVNTGTLPASKSTTTSFRQPVVIRGGMKKSTGTMRPPKGRSGVVSIAVIGVILLIALGTSMSVIPAGGESGRGFSIFQPVFNLMQSHGGAPNAIAQQAATATAVIHQDGYDPGMGNTNNTVAGQTNTGFSPAPILTSNGGGLDRFAFGQCTYWANLRYHEMTGYYVPWLGNAYQWSYGAAISGWVVSPTPRVPSIVVLQPGVQGAGPYGHVAVVERINSDGSVYTSNYNWWATGGWDILSYATFHPGPGVLFVWHP